jgi:hypothetical protein
MSIAFFNTAAIITKVFYGCQRYISGGFKVLVAR